MTQKESSQQQQTSQKISRKFTPKEGEYKYRAIQETLNFITGVCIIVVTLPLIGVVSTLSFVWDFVDRLVTGQFAIFGQTQSGLTSIVGRKICEHFYDFNIKVVKYKEDAFMVCYLAFFVVVLPLAFFASLTYTYYFGFSLVACIIYNVFRVGPYMINFAYLYTMCHKEGHHGSDLYNPKYKFLNGIFNYWIGLFYGVLPSVFFFGHSQNHHKYNNAEEDIITTADRPRDNFFNYIKYLTRFSLFSVNITTIGQFLKEGKYQSVVTIIMGTLYYFTFFAMVSYVNLYFAIGYVLYPLLEQNLFLSTTNWTWHAFISKENPDGIFGNSITIQEGLLNVLNEDFHVVHHQYPGLHWSRYPALYEKHIDTYKKENAFTIKYVHQFSMWALIIFRQYKWMARLMVDQSNTLSFDQKVEFVKERLRNCSWGPNKNCTALVEESNNINAEEKKKD